MADTVPGSTLGTPSTGGTNTQGLADWASPYITGYLGQAQALGQTPYQTYQGPLTAGPSALQQNVFQGLAGLSVPSNLGQSFSSSGAYAPPTMNTSANMQPFGTGQTPSAPMTSTPSASASPTGVAANYMNPYLQAVLDPQLAELRRQNDITNMQANAKLTGAGAFGGSRQAIMNAENNRNLMQEMNKTVGQGYANAYDKAMQQFNTEQGQSRDLVNMLAQQGATQQGLEQQGVAADLAEFEKQRQYPYQQIQFQRDMISGLPVSSVSNTPGALSGIGTLLAALGTGTSVAKDLGYKNAGELLTALGLNLGPSTSTTTTPST
jgi:hypothetical protein